VKASSFRQGVEENSGEEALVYKGMALYLAGDYDEAMKSIIQNRFMGKFKEELIRKEGPQIHQAWKVSQ
jgi:hypothetical protein